MLDCQRTEIFIKGYQHAVFLISTTQDHFIARVDFPLSCPDDIVPSYSECRTYEYA